MSKCLIGGVLEVGEVYAKFDTIKIIKLFSNMDQQALNRICDKKNVFEVADFYFNLFNFFSFLVFDSFDRFCWIESALETTKKNFFYSSMLLEVEKYFSDSEYVKD